MKQHPMTLFFKLDTISELMDRCDLADGGHKIFCQVLDIVLETEDNWALSPLVVETFEKAFTESGALSNTNTSKEAMLCGIWDASNEVFYNFTDKKDKITMFSDGKNFAYFCTEEDIKKENYIKAYNHFIFHEKQSKNDKYVYNLSNWLINEGEKNDSSK